MSPVTAAVDVVVCRGCCCGTARKRPGTDHEGQLASLAEAVAALPAARLVVTDCLGPCEQANVVVVRPRGRLQDGRRARPVWFGNVTDATGTAELCAWIGEISRTAGQVSPEGPLSPLLDSLRIPAPGPERVRDTTRRAGPSKV
ncbi:(2Fe-2S) ferredoxin domain-containing protein [Kitasatospora sp. NBC_00085]|uniref:(2Fe-2S) ferredoxin domain-containing protein n=1 Tax=unclassified Kitasatospora TaxID=2633591 RepID=UPI003244E695